MSKAGCFTTMIAILGIFVVLGTMLVRFILGYPIPTYMYTLIPVLIALGGGGFVFATAFADIGNEVKDGIETNGVIVSLRSTGAFRNNHPVVEFTVRFTTIENKEITAVDRKIAPLTSLAQFQPGAMIPLRYDPANPQTIMVEVR